MHEFDKWKKQWWTVTGNEQRWNISELISWELCSHNTGRMLLNNVPLSQKVPSKSTSRHSQTGPSSVLIQMPPCWQGSCWMHMSNWLKRTPWKRKQSSQFINNTYINQHVGQSIAYDPVVHWFEIECKSHNEMYRLIEIDFVFFFFFQRFCCCYWSNSKMEKRSSINTIQMAMVACGGVLCLDWLEETSKDPSQLTWLLGNIKKFTLKAQRLKCFRKVSNSERFWPDKDHKNRTRKMGTNIHMITSFNQIKKCIPLRRNNQMSNKITHH